MRLRQMNAGLLSETEMDRESLVHPSPENWHHHQCGPLQSVAVPSGLRRVDYWRLKMVAEGDRMRHIPHEDGLQVAATLLSLIAVLCENPQVEENGPSEA
jgi:hypothetical protein